MHIWKASHWAQGKTQPNRLVLFSPATIKRRVASLPACSGPPAFAPSSETSSEEGQSPEVTPPVGPFGHRTRSSASTPGGPEAEGDADTPVLPVLLLLACRSWKHSISQDCHLTAQQKPTHKPCICVLQIIWHYHHHLAHYKRSLLGDSVYPSTAGNITLAWFL